MATFTTYDGSHVTATVLGPPSEPVVVLPGGPLRVPGYLGNLGGLDAYRELVVLELPHRGVDQLVGDVEALREHLGRETLDVIAHSAGAALAMLYAAAHPERIGRLALVAPSGDAAGIRPTPDEYAAALARRTDQPRRPPVGADETPPDAHAIYYGAGAFDAEATRAALAKVGGDVLVLVGGADPATPVRLGVELGQLFAHAEVVVQPGAGHYPWLDDPEWFAATIGRFLAS